MTPQARSRQLLSAAGWTVATVEWFNVHTRRRHDLFGFGDLLAMKPGTAPCIIQVTSGSNVSSRLAKIAGLPEAGIALASGFTIEIHGWRKLKSNRNRWTPRILLVTQELLAEQCPLQPTSPAPASPTPTPD